jgi:hypothetical protein
MTLGQLQARSPDVSYWLRNLLAVRRAILPAEDVAVLPSHGEPSTILERVTGNQWRCGLWPVPFIEPAAIHCIREVLEVARRNLSAQVVYFPTLDARQRVTSNLQQLDDAMWWPRMPSPVVEPPFGAGEVWTRVAHRLGSRATRRARRFDRAGLVWKELRGAAAISAISAIEARSWKSTVKSDMHHWDHQFATYAQLITRQLVRGLFAVDGDRPVAHVLFAPLGRVVLIAKWSFDETYRSFSPGFNLLTRGFWEAVDLSGSHLVDLYGSPDPLKAVLETGRRPRVDVAWPRGPIASTLRRERMSHDTSNTRRRSVEPAGGGVGGPPLRQGHSVLRDVGDRRSGDRDVGL